MTMDFGWEEWQLNVIDDYILGYHTFEKQQDLADHIGKNLNSVKIRISRRKKELEETKRKLTRDEYITFLSNRFSKSSVEISEMLNLSSGFLLDELDETDCLECKEYLLEDFDKRQMSKEELELIIKFYSKGLTAMTIAHILNRNIEYIEEQIKAYASI